MSEISNRKSVWAKKTRPLFYLALPFLIACMLGIFLITLEKVNAQSLLLTNDKIGQEVLETLQTEGEAHIVIALTNSQTMRAQPTHLTNLKRDVAAAQESVLSTLNDSDFQLKNQYQAVHALSGILLTEAGLMKLVQNPNVLKIDLDVGGSGSLAISVPLIGADTWQVQGNTGEGVVVAILDSGLDTDHTDLADALIHEECFLDADGLIDGNGLCPNGSDRQSGTGAAEDDAGHGTHVSGIVGSRGNESSVGVAPGVDIVSIKVTSGPTFSGVFYSFTEVVAGLDFIINNRPDVQVINMSLVTGATFSGNCDNATAWTMAGAEAINTLRANGVIAFASSGNTGSGADMAAPACLSNVVSVGATDNSDNVAVFTSSNSTTDIMAPGVSILSSNLANNSIIASGTSMASPHAAGCAALLIAADEAVTPDEIETRLKTSPVQVTDTTNSLTFPRIDCRLKPLTDVSITGAITGTLGDNYDFIANISPMTATLPITYVWQTSGQAPITHTNGLSDTHTFNWSTFGLQTITVTVQNFAGMVANTHFITIESKNVYLPIILK